MHRHMDHFRRKFENPKEYLDNILEKGAVIAELGCGSGYYCEYLKEYASTLYCVDSFCPVLEEAKKKAPSAIFLCEDASHTSIPNNSVDVVLFANSFHDMDNKDDVVKEVRRILKRNGKVIIIDWEKKPTLFGPPMWVRMSEEEYLEYFKGFKLVNKFKPSEHHYGLVLVEND